MDKPVKTRIVLCDVLGVGSYLSCPKVLDPLLHTISVAFEKAIMVSECCESPYPQQGFGDAVWWTMVDNPNKFIGSIKSYAFFTAHLLERSQGLPFVLVAPAAICYGEGFFREYPWTKRIPRQEVVNLTNNKLPINWLYSNSVKVAWNLIEKEKRWRTECKEAAPIVLVTGTPEEEEDALREISIALQTNKGNLRTEKIKMDGEDLETTRINNFFELTIELAISTKTIRLDGLKKLVNVTQNFIDNSESINAKKNQEKVKNVLNKVIKSNT